MIQGGRAPTPIWLSDPDYPAPCPCGEPMMNGEPVVLAEGDYGLKRIFHYRCAQAAMMQQQDDD